jgi:V/A-type H+-transporting ATPase subunit I
MIRPQPARWFEILVARDDAAGALEALAGTGAVELEPREGVAMPAVLAEVAPLVAAFAELAQRYRAYWPKPAAAPQALPEAPAQALSRALAALRAWAADAEAPIRALQAATTTLDQLRRWQRILAQVPAGAFDAVRLTGAGPLLGARVFALPPGIGPAGSGTGGGGVTGGGLIGSGPAAAESGGLGSLRSAADDVLTVPFAVDGAPHLIAVGTADALSTLALSVSAQKGRDEGLPPWLAADAAANGRTLVTRIADAEREIVARREDIAALSRAHALPAALAVARRLEWVLANVKALETTDLFCRITGWTSDVAGERVAAALDASAARALLHFPAPPRRAHAPLLFANPWWARPYEIFTRALGMPAQDEADPSVLLAVAVPLLFGYMFGDVGQGAVLAVAGWTLRHRHPIAKLVFVGGLAAIVFGFAFGSVFGLHILAPLWVQPLAEPLRVLAAPVAGGAVLLTIGLVLGAVEAHWRQAFAAWLVTGGPFLVAYIALMASVADTAALYVAAAAFAAFCAGHAWVDRRAAAALPAIAEFVERMVQLLINTLSFARVGAFALAHAGLSSAIAALIASADALWLQGLVLVLGNALILVLEAMVVSIQTTRLVLFEFFTRFLTAAGRPFRPLPPPPSLSPET